MEQLAMAFMAAVVGNLIWIGLEIHQVCKKLSVKPHRRNARDDKPEGNFKESHK